MSEIANLPTSERQPLAVNRESVELPYSPLRTVTGLSRLTRRAGM